MISIANRHKLFIIFLAAYAVLSLITYKDFGPTTDERVERRAAEDLLHYLSKPTDYNAILGEDFNSNLRPSSINNPLTTRYQRSYQLVQSYINPTDYYEWDHLINMALSSLFFIIVYIIFYRQYRSSKLSLIAVIFLFLTPRFLGHIPANNKDIPFALLYLASLASILLFPFDYKNKYLRIIVLGTIFGLTETFRIVGLSIYLIYIAFWIYHCFSNNIKITKKIAANFILELIIITAFSFFVTILFFPRLGSNFIANFYDLLINSRHFQYWTNTMLFAGEYVTKENRPWHYLFTWILITTPAFILGLLAVGIFNIKSLFKNSLFSLMFISLVINLLLYLILNPTIYNGLRHFLYLVPIISILAAIVFITLLQNFKNKKHKIILWSVVSIGMISVLYNVITLHPYQYIYFNEFIGGIKGASGKYELDYWGATYKEATEWAVKNTDWTRSTFVDSCTADYVVDYYSEKKFFQSFGDVLRTDYIMCGIDSDIKRGLDGEILHEVERQGVVLLRIREFNKPTQ